MRQFEDIITKKDKKLPYSKQLQNTDNSKSNSDEQKSIEVDCSQQRTVRDNTKRQVHTKKNVELDRVVPIFTIQNMWMKYEQTLRWDTERIFVGFEMRGLHRDVT